MLALVPEGCYRSHRDELRRRWAELVPMRAAELERLENVTAHLAGARMGRVVGGVAGALCAMGTFVYALVTLSDSQLDRGTTVLLLVLSWGVAALGWGVGRLLGRQALLLTLRRRLRPQSDELVREVERLEALRLDDEARRVVVAHATGSIAWPLAAFCMLGPLTIHLVLWALVATPSSAPTDWIEGFGTWIALSAVIVGHVHLLLAVLAWRYARRLASDPWGPKSGWLRVYAWTVAASCAPGALLFLIPPAVVAITGILVIPAAFGWARACMARETSDIERSVCLGHA